jgi:acyl-CoA thioester hydrolase
MAHTSDFDPFCSRGHVVRPEWIDEYDHMNMSRYVALFDDVTYALLDRVDLGLDYTRRTRRGLFTVDARVRFLKELRVGTPLIVSLRLIGVDQVRLHMWLELIAETSGVICATQEQLGVHVDLESRKTIPFDPDVRERLQDVVEAHRRDPLYAGHEFVMGCKGA